MASELLIVHENPRPIEHNQLGVHFSHYDTQRGAYIPNPDLCLHYPDDLNL